MLFFKKNIYLYFLFVHYLSTKHIAYRRLTSTLEKPKSIFFQNPETYILSPSKTVEVYEITTPKN
jgi:hypothetical protein